MNIRKNWKGYITELFDNNDGTYTVTYFNGQKDVFSKNGIVRKLNSVVRQFSKAMYVKKIFEDKNVLESLEFVRDNQDKLKDIINTMPLHETKDKIKIDIPDEVLNIDSDTILSIRGNREYYKKFKMYVASLGIPLTDFTNYLFYFAMNKMMK